MNFMGWFRRGDKGGKGKSSKTKAAGKPATKVPDEPIAEEEVVIEEAVPAKPVALTVADVMGDGSRAFVGRVASLFPKDFGKQAAILALFKVCQEKKRWWALVRTVWIQKTEESLKVGNKPTGLAAPAITALIKDGFVRKHDSQGKASYAPSSALIKQLAPPAENTDYEVIEEDVPEAQAVTEDLAPLKLV